MSPSPRSRRWPAACFAAAWLVVVCVFWFGLFRPSTLSGVRRFVGLDLTAYFYPKFVYGVGELAAGRLPLWNPYEYAGLPFLAAAQPATLYPPWWLVYPLPAPLAFQAFMVLHYLAIGAIAFAALRWLGSSVAGAALGAVVATFNPPIMDFNYHPTHLASLTWAMGIFVAALATIDRPGPAPAGLLAVLLSLELLAGYPEFSLDTGMLLALLAAARILGVARARGAVAAWRAVLWLSAGAGVFLLLTALQWVPLIEMQGQSYRAQTAPAPVSALEVRAEALGGGVAGWLRSAAEVLHLAPLAWACVLCALIDVSDPARRERAAGTATWGFLAAVPVLLLLLVPGPLHAVFPFNLFRATVVWNSMFYIPAAVLAARGLDACLTEHGRLFASHRRAIAAALLTAASAWFVSPRGLAWFAAGLAAVALARRVKPGVARTALEALVVATALFSTWTWIPATIPGGPYLHRYSRGEHPLPEPVARVAAQGEAILATCGPNQGRLLAPGLAYTGAAVLAHLPLFNGYPESIAPARMRRVLDACGVPPHTGAVDWTLLARCGPWLDRLDVGCARFEAGHDDALASAGFAPVAGDASQTTYRRPTPGQARLVATAVPATSPDEAFALVASGDLDATSVVVLEGLPAAIDASGHSPDVGTIVRLQADEPGLVQIDLEAREPAFLVLSEAWYPGWEAAIDGVAAPVYRADFAVMATHVPPGRHTVRLRYAPRSVRIGEWLSLAGLICVAACVAGARRRRIRGWTNPTA
jgi:hypothetical protein